MEECCVLKSIYTQRAAQGDSVKKNRIDTVTKTKMTTRIGTHNTSMSVPPWLHREISFNRQDQLAAIPEPGHFPLILDPCINSVRFERVLVDGGSSIDTLFRNSLPALKLTPAQLKPYDAQFWGVLPGQSSVPLRQITLPVQFGMPDHFHTEFVNFVVADFDGT